MCPMIAAGLAHLQRATVAAGIDQQVQLLAVSYDPGYDTPERLKAYGERFGLQWTNARLLRPTTEQFRDLIGEFSIDVRGTADGNINHRIELILIDSQGRYVRDYQAAIWDSKAVVEDLGKLAAEGRGPVASMATP
jgi:protein SCO1/2